MSISVDHAPLSLGCVVLAAGSARRFGANKLLEPLGGRSLIRRALEAVPAAQCQRVVVVTQYPEIVELAKEFSFAASINPEPERGLSSSVAIGLRELSGCGGILFQVADQPLLRRESVEALAALWRQRPEHIAALSNDGLRGNPCLFPARFYPELLALTGDQGGSSVIRAHPEALELLEVPVEELLDADSPAALERLRALEG